MLLVNSCGQLCHVLQDMFIMKATKAMIHDQDLPMFLWEKESILQFILRRGFITRYWGQDLLGIIHRSEARGDSLEDILLSSIHPCTKEEEE